MNKPKAIAFDLDGTLAESKQRVSAEMGEILSNLLNEIPLAIMSGASFKQVQMQFLPSLPAEAKLERLFLFPTNAALCFVYRDGAWKPQYDHSFTQTEKNTILNALNEALKDTHLDAKPDTLWGEQIDDRGAQITWSALGQLAPLEVKSKWDPDRSKRLPLRTALLKLLPMCSIGVNATNSIDITRKGITKAYGVKRFSELTNIPIAETLFVGDALDEGGNDSVVLDTGIPTHSVFGPEDTAAFIETLLHKA